MPCYVTTNKPASREDYKLWCGMGYTGSYRDYEAVKKTHEGARISIGNAGYAPARGV